MVIERKYLLSTINWVQTVDHLTGNVFFVNKNDGSITKSNVVPHEIIKLCSSLKSLDLSDIGYKCDPLTPSSSYLSRGESDPNWKGAGAKEGIEIWRVENKRSDLGTPEFGVNHWPKELYGRFHKGDSYIVLKTTKQPSGKLFYDVHFWIGAESTIDEYAVAAIKTVELDDLLSGLPVQHREVMGCESEQFHSYFSLIEYLDGGIDSGLKASGSFLKDAQTKSQMFRIRKEKGERTSVFEVPCLSKSLNQNDAFVVDTTKKVYIWCGSRCSPFERAGASFVQTNIVSRRFGKAVKMTEIDSEFWDIVGSEEQVVDVEGDSTANPEDTAKFPPLLWRLSDAEGGLKILKLPVESPKLADLNSGDVFIIDVGVHVYAWVGNNASSSERKMSLPFVSHYLKITGRSATPCTRIIEGQPNKVLDAMLAS